MLGNSGVLVKSNHTFIGWSTNSNAVSVQYVQGQTFVITQNVVLYAVWVPPLTVTYDGNGSTGGVVPVDCCSPCQYGSTVTVLGSGNLWLSGFIFMGWDTDPLSSTPLYSPGSTFIITENTVLYAVWLSGGPPVGNLYFVNYDGNTPGSYPPTDWAYPAGTVVTILGKGFLVKSAHVFVGWAFSSSAVVPDYLPGDTFVMPPNSFTLYAVWKYVGGIGGGTPVFVNVSSSVVVDSDGYYGGGDADGSKGRVLYYTGLGNDVVVRVVSNAPSNLSCSGCVIENLIIDGANKLGVVGVLLENVCGCLVRNVTIMNCEVGIKVRLTSGGGGSLFGNRFEHVRLINVERGIVFECASGVGGFFLVWLLMMWV